MHTAEVDSPEVLKQNQILDLQKDASEIVRVSDDEGKTPQELKNEVDHTLKKNNQVLLATMEKVLGKGVEVLILKNGENVMGIIYQTGNRYNVKTPQGNLQFADFQVSGLRF
ncbi:hypothetical protein AB3N59_12050 [Leptospira sp. WS92.C1]